MSASSFDRNFDSESEDQISGLDDLGDLEADLEADLSFGVNFSF